MIKKGMYIVIMVLAAACSRESGSGSGGKEVMVSIRVPARDQLSQTLSAQSVSLPTDKRVCYGIHVSGKDIPVGLPETSCHGNFSQTAGFVAEGETITLSVSKGSARIFELYVYLTDLGSTCPSWNAVFESNQQNYDKVMLSGTSGQVNLVNDEEYVSLSLNYPGIDNSLGTLSGNSACISTPPPAVLHATLGSDGSLVNIKTNPDVALAFAKPFWEWFFELVIGTFTATDVAGVTASSLITYSDVETQPYLRSFSRKPDEDEIYALDESGLIYQILPGGTVNTTYTCPFSRCTVPLWVQSISPGRMNKLYALDHSGVIYEVTASDLVPVGITVLPSVTQVSYY
jgi:hypothetical protein